MKTAIILHGMPSKEEYYNIAAEAPSNQHWLPWIQRRLLLKDILAQAIELPKPDEPVYEDWKKVFEQFDVDEETILIGHSCGAGFLTRWLSENKVRVGKVVLVAPWIDPEHDELKNGFFDFALDPTVPTRTGGLTIFSSTNDDVMIQKSITALRAAWPDSKLVEFKDYGHFCFDDMKTHAFPELEEEILG